MMTREPQESLRSGLRNFRSLEILFLHAFSCLAWYDIKTETNFSFNRFLSKIINSIVSAWNAREAKWKRATLCERDAKIRQSDGT